MHELNRDVLGIRSSAVSTESQQPGVDFIEYDVEWDEEALGRMLGLTGGNRTVPVIFEEGKPVQVGWMGRGCAV
jgi:glutaredoxin 3